MQTPIIFLYKHTCIYIYIYILYIHTHTHIHNIKICFYGTLRDVRMPLEQICHYNRFILYKVYQKLFQVYS